jgi:hypothetical protein
MICPIGAGNLRYCQPMFSNRDLIVTKIAEAFELEALQRMLLSRNMIHYYLGKKV